MKFSESTLKMVRKYKLADMVTKREIKKNEKSRLFQLRRAMTQECKHHDGNFKS